MRQEAIELLENSRMAGNTHLLPNVSYYAVCPAKFDKALALLRAEPEAGEFTKSLQETLRHLRFWKDHPHAGLPSYITEAEKGLSKACKLIDRLTAELKEHRWITVCERLPELNIVGNEGGLMSDWVHITDGKKVIDAYYYDFTKREAKPNYETGKGWYCHGMSKEKITHWKPIILPQEKQDAQTKSS